MKAVNQSDEWLMGQVAAGKRDCLEVLVRRYATPLLTYLTRMCGDVHRAEELVQEVFLAVWVKRKTYKLNKPFRAWLYTIATNKCRSAFRGNKGKNMASLEDNPAASRPDDMDTPVEAMLGSERAGIVTEAVAKLAGAAADGGDAAGVGRDVVQRNRHQCRANRSDHPLAHAPGTGVAAEVAGAGIGE